MSHHFSFNIQVNVASSPFPTLNELYCSRASLAYLKRALGEPALTASFREHFIEGAWGKHVALVDPDKCAIIHNFDCLLMPAKTARGNPVPVVRDVLSIVDATCRRCVTPPSLPLVF